VDKDAYDIAPGPDGNVWITEYGGKVGYVTPGGAVTEYSLGSGVTPTYITGLGSSTWFTASVSGDNAVFQITDTGTVTEYHDVIVTVAHPWGDVETTLRHWIDTGPGPRPFVTIIAARWRDGRPLRLEEIPLHYRNNLESRRLQRLGLLPAPWARLPTPSPDRRRPTTNSSGVTPDGLALLHSPASELA
jgi:hypothetical protein